MSTEDAAFVRETVGMDLDDTLAVASPHAQDLYMSEVDEVYSMSPDEFMKLTPKQRERAMFILQREQAGQIRLLLFKVEEWESKLNATLSPEGMQELSDRVLGSFGGGMLKGVFG